MGSKTLELVNRILRGVGWKQVTTLETDPQPGEVQKILDLLNVVAREVGAFTAYDFLRRRTQLVTLAATEGVTATATNGNAYVTLTAGSTALASYGRLDGRALHFSVDREVYRIVSTYVFNSVVVIEPAYLGTTISTASAVTIAQDTYDLPADFDRPFNVAQFIGVPYAMRAIDASEMLSRKAMAFSVGTPQYYTLMMSEDGVWQIVFDPYPEDAVIITYDYLPTIQSVLKDNDQLPFPLRMEDILIEGTTYLLKRDQQNDLQSAQLTIQDYLRKRAEGIKLTSTSPRMSITPSTAQRARQRLKYSRARVDYGDEWDKMV